MSNLHLKPKKRLHITDLSTRAAIQTSQALFVWLVKLTFVTDSSGGFCLIMAVWFGFEGNSRYVWDTWLIVCFWFVGSPRTPHQKGSHQKCLKSHHKGQRGQKLLKEKVMPLQNKTKQNNLHILSWMHREFF